MDRIKEVRQKRGLGILFLQGVFKTDCKRMEDILQDRLLGDSPSNLTTYIKMPAVFTGLENWPKYTNILCNICSRSFKTFPWFEPQSIDPISTGDVGKILRPEEVKKSITKKDFSIVPKGVFCSCHCVEKNIRTKTVDLSEKRDKQEMLKFLYEIVTGKSVKEILPSPDPTDMVQYGGDLTEVEYQKKIDGLIEKANADVNDNISMICSIYLNKLSEQ